MSRRFGRRIAKRVFEKILNRLSTQWENSRNFRMSCNLLIIIFIYTQSSSTTFSPRLATVYYQPLATDRLFSVPTTALRAGPPGFDDELPVTLIGRKSSQGIGLSVDPRDDSIIFSPLTETAIAIWQPQTNAQRILAYSPELIQFAAEVRWVERDSGNIWALTTRFQKFFKKQVDPTDLNLRILRIRPENVVPRPIYPLRHFNVPAHPSFYNRTLSYF
ncbi:unnamed protein product [Trichogramma brassicae]|uniref:Uncharacterized protein n=1 Tax=Trichogramma brassicae TaxID=86971 RepID=A0A6H5HU33_9HYME|nr:unnamed protein product [Trichogramma brassicae]